MFRKLKIIVWVSVILFGFFLVNGAQALTLGISGNKFTVDGSAKFLTFVSYFDAIRAPNGTLDSDLAYLKSKNIDGIRIFPNWWGSGSQSNPPSDTLMDPNGNLQPNQLANLKNVVAVADGKGLAVDISFANIVPGLSISNYKKAIIATVTALSGNGNIFYDIHNEYNCAGLSASDIKNIRDAIKAQSSSAIVSASNACGASPSEAVTITNSANLNLINYHDNRTADWYNQTSARVKSIMPASKPIYFGEPEKWTSGSGLTADNFVTAVTQAKSAGAAAWTFHTKSAYNLGAGSMQNSLDVGVEKKFLDTFSSKLSAVTWGGGGGTAPPPVIPPPGGGGGPAPGVPPGPGNPPDPVPPPIPGDSSEINATPGWEGSLAYNSVANNWLVVSQNVRKIAGQIMDDDGQRIGAPINITASGMNLTPRALYSPDINKFLVVWVRENTTTDLSILGQFINPDGTMSGNPIQIDRGTFIFHANTSVQYDAKNKQFVLVWENRANRSVQVALNTLSSTGQPGTRVNVTTQSGGSFNGAPSVAVNEQDGQYCVMYQHVVDPVANTPSEVTVIPVSAPSLQLGQPSILTKDAFFVYNIAYNSTDNNYMGIWSDYKLTGLKGKIFSDCKNDPNADDIVIGEQYPNGNLSYNPKSNSYAIIVEETTGTNNTLYIIDSNGGSISNSVVFTGGNNGNFGPRVAANTMTGLYAAITSEDHATTKFSSNLGGSELLMSRSGAGAFPAQITLPVPNKGLPTDLGQLISAIFVWSLSLIGLVIFVRFFYAGFLWFTAAGSSDRTSRAKTIMKNAVYGTLVLFSAYLILNTINPDLVKSTFTLPGLPAGQTTTGTGSTGATPTTIPVTCNNGVCSNGFVGPCQTATQCQPVVTCNNGVCSNGFIGPCQTAAQCH